MKRAPKGSAGGFKGKGKDKNPQNDFQKEAIRSLQLALV